MSKLQPVFSRLNRACFEFETFVVLDGKAVAIGGVDVAAFEPDSHDWSWLNMVFAAATVPLAVVGYRHLRRRQKSKSKMLSDSDEYFANGILDDIWLPSKIEHAAGRERLEIKCI